MSKSTSTSEGVTTRCAFSPCSTKSVLAGVGGSGGGGAGDGSQGQVPVASSRRQRCMVNQRRSMRATLTSGERDWPALLREQD